MANEKHSALEDYGASPVPAEEAKGWFGIGIVYWGMSICLPAFLVAGMVAGPARLGMSIGVFLVASVVLGSIAILTGVLGAGTKLSTALSSRFTFGKYGAYVLQFMLFFAFWGWFGVQLGFMVNGLGDGGLVMVMGDAIPVWLLKIIGGALMTLTAMFGFKAIEKLSIVAIPLLIIIILATIVSEFSGDKSLADVAGIAAEGAMPFGVAVSVVIATYILGGLCAPDITRYSKSKSAGGYGMVFGMLIGFPIILILGAIMVKGGGGEIDFSKIMLTNNSGFWSFLAVITIILAAWTTNDNNLYSGALSLNAMFPKVKKWIITVISGVIGTILALAGINTAAGFTAFLGILAIFIPPAAGIMIVDYYFFRGKENLNYEAESVNETPSIRWIPVIAWAIASICGLLIQYTSFTLTTVTALDTILIGGVVYFVIMFVAKKPVGVKSGTEQAAEA